MKKVLFGINWRTSLAGYGLAAAYAALTVVSGGAFAFKDVAIAIGFAVIGKLSKDAGVSGVEK